MIQHSIRLDTRGAARYLGRVESIAYRKAVVRTLNDLLRGARAEGARSIREERNLKAKTIKAAMTPEKANRHDWTASIVASGAPIPLREYGAHRTRRGVTVKVRRRGRRKLVTTRTGQRAFIVDKLGGHVFARQGKKRLPIQKRYGPTIPSALVRREVFRHLDELVKKRFPAIFARHFAYYEERERGR